MGGDDRGYCRGVLTPLLVSFVLVAGAPAAQGCDLGLKLTIDNGDPGYAETGDDWATWGNQGQSVGSDYRYLSKTVGGADRRGTATWTPAITQAGMYKVEAVFRATVNRSSDANYLVHPTNGSPVETVVDQRDGAKSESDAHGPVYADLGTHWFEPGAGKVVLDGTDDDQSDEADAVVFTLVDCGTNAAPAEPIPAAPQSPPVYAASWVVGQTDGDLSEWGKAEAVVLSAPADYVSLAGIYPESEADHRVELKVGWRQNVLVLAVVVDDVEHHPNDEAGLLWLGDSLQVAIGSTWEVAVAAVAGETRVECSIPSAATCTVVAKATRAGSKTTYELELPTPTGAGATKAVTVLVNENDGAGREGWLEWTPGVGLAKDPAQYAVVTLVGDPSQTPSYAAPWVDAVVDGALDEWSGAPEVALGAPADFVSVAGGSPTNAQDLSARLKLGWRGGSLVVAVSVSDDVHAPSEVAGELWQGDSVQIAIDVLDGVDYGPDDWEVGVARVVDSTWLDCYHPADGVCAVQVSGKASEVGYDYELEVPVAGLNVGMTLGVTVLVNEDDTGGREGWLEWTPGIGVSKNPAAYAVVTLVGGPPEPPEEDGGGTDETGTGNPGFGTGDGDTGGSEADGGDTGSPPTFTGGGDGAMTTSGSPDITSSPEPETDTAASGCVAGESPVTPWSIAALLILLFWVRVWRRERPTQVDIRARI